jgi:SAM-dependent methyltransferase
VTFPRGRIERIARIGEIKMPSRKLVRAIPAVVGVVLVALLLYLLLHHGSRAPQIEPGNDFDPADFVRGRPRLDVPYVATDLQAVDAMLGLAQVKPDDYVIDLGSGDGRILIAAARSLGAHGLGVDIDPARIREATANAQEAGVSGRVVFRQQDLFETPLAQADVLTLYLLPEINLRLRPRILSQMQPGARVVSHDYDMGDWHWDERRRVGNATIYLWTIPANVAGTWTLTSGGRGYPLVIEQQYQQFHGNAGEGRIEQGRLTGAHIRFLANLGEGRRTFEGRVEGNRIVPLTAAAGWHAERVR